MTRVYGCRDFVRTDTDFRPRLLFSEHKYAELVHVVHPARKSMFRPQKPYVFLTIFFGTFFDFSYNSRCGGFEKNTIFAIWPTILFFFLKNCPVHPIFEIYLCKNRGKFFEKINMGNYMVFYRFRRKNDPKTAKIDQKSTQK